MPVLAGLVPGVTVTVSRVVLPACRALGLAAPVALGGVEEGVTDTAIEAPAVRDWASVIVADRDLAPAVVAPGTVAWNEKTLSPAVTSPCVPSSKKPCA